MYGMSTFGWYLWSMSGNIPWMLWITVYMYIHFSCCWNLMSFSNQGVQGLSGDFCSPKCNSQGSCPSDVPKGDSATPQCALRTTTGDKYCALICQSDSDCGIWAAWRCLIIEMTGVWLVRKECIGPDMLVSKTLAVTIQLMNTCSYGSLFNWVIFGNDRWDI